MTKIKTYQVKDLSSLSGVSVRTLHYYGEIGLLSATARTHSGYRLYDDDSLFRLQQILIKRELGLSLEGIKASLDDPNHDLKSTLLKQRKTLNERKLRTNEILKAIDSALEQLEEKKMAKDKLFKGFNPEEHEVEAKEKWGGTDAYSESKRRTKKYTKENLAEINQFQADKFDKVAALMVVGKTINSIEVQDVVEAHRLYIDRWFYPCSKEMHQGLAAMYKQDERFQKTFDQHGEGLALFFADAILEGTRA